MKTKVLNIMMIIGLVIVVSCITEFVFNAFFGIWHLELVYMMILAGVMAIGAFVCNKD